jgi:hypothetical protein
MVDFGSERDLRVFETTGIAGYFVADTMTAALYF